MSRVPSPNSPFVVLLLALTFTLIRENASKGFLLREVPKNILVFLKVPAEAESINSLTKGLRQKE